MTQYEIIQMANEAGLNSYRIAPAEAVAVWERFAALVEAKEAAKEREACACLALINGKDAPTPEDRDMAQAIAASIRARSSHVA